MANRYMKRCSASLINRKKCKSKTTMRYYLKPVVMAIIKKTKDKYWEDIEQRVPLYIVGGNVNWCSHYEKQCGGRFLKKIINRTAI